MSLRKSSVVPIAGALVSDALPDNPVAHRESGGADSETDMSAFTAGLKETLNKGALVIWGYFGTAAATATLSVIYFDDDNNPMAISESITLTASTKRVSASGAYISDSKIVDTRGFKRFKVYKDAVSAGNVTIYAEPV